MTFDEARSLSRQQQHAVHAMLSRGWTVMYRGAISGDVYMKAIGGRCLAIKRDGTVEKLA